MMETGNNEMIISAVIKNIAQDIESRKYSVKDLLDSSEEKNLVAIDPCPHCGSTTYVITHAPWALCAGDGKPVQIQQDQYGRTRATCYCPECT